MVETIGLLVVVQDLLDQDHQHHQLEQGEQVLVEEVLMLVVEMQEIIVRGKEMVLQVLPILVAEEEAAVPILLVVEEMVVQE